jgi:SAM-dependent methyltransferase
MPESWDEYLLDYHDANPGITEELLSVAHDGAGRSPYDWLAEALPAGVSTVVDLACGSGPVARLLAGVRVVGVDQSAGELARASGLRVRATASALPLAGGRAGAVVTSMALMLLHPLEAVLAEVARVLRPGGTFVATLPTRSTGCPVFTTVLRELDQVGVRYPERLDTRVAERFQAAGLQLVADDSEVFSRTVRDRDDAVNVVRSFYAPGAGPEQVAGAVASLERLVPVDVGYRLRRLVARGAG